MSITRTSLIHPTMIKKIRAAMYYASKGQGHKMEGHGKRCYIQNAKGHNIMRLDWHGGRQGYTVWGAESRNITKMVRNALASVVARELMVNQEQLPTTKATQYAEAYSAGPATVKLLKAACVALAAGALSACQSPGAYTALAGFVNGLFS